jgi:N-methylhydantoinase A/oxoprolinase/acetone carboxylase beta subunit
LPPCRGDQAPSTVAQRIRTVISDAMHRPRSTHLAQGPVRKVLRPAGAPAGAVAGVSHGTTVATNALLEERFDGLAMVTTEGSLCVY